MMVTIVKLVKLMLAGIIVIVGGLFISSQTIQHQIHWMQYGYDRVCYHNRTYINPNEYTAQQLDSKFGRGEQFIPSGDHVIGLPVYETSGSLAMQQQKHVVSTLLFLKKANGNFVVYELSGGP